MRNCFLALLNEKGMEPELVNEVLGCFDQAAAGFTITPKETGLIVGGGFPELAKTYIAVKAVEGCAKGTLEDYRRVLEAFFRDIGHPMDKITTNLIRGYLFTYRSERNVLLSRLDKIRQIISGFFAWATDEGYLEKNPAKPIKPIRSEKRQRHALDRLQLERMRRACTDDRDRAIIDLLFSTACRASEMINIKLSDVDFVTKEIRVIGKGNKERTVYLNASAVLSLRTYLNSRGDESPWLIVSERAPHHQLTRDGLGLIVRRISKAACVECSPHVIRHTTATLAMKAGMPVQDIQKMLGHSSISTTMIYAEQDPADVKAEHTRCVV